MTAPNDQADDPFDERIRLAAPPTTPASPARANELLTMISDARREAAPETTRTARPRRAGWITAAIALGAVMLGGGTAATAVGVFDWAPWAQDPDYSYSYTLPSGAVCEMRLGDIEGATPQALDAIREYSASVDLMALADIDGAMAEYRSGSNIWSDEFGNTEEITPGSPHYNADWEYHMVVDNAVSELVYNEMIRQGFDRADLGDSMSGQWNCPGAAW